MLKTTKNTVLKLMSLPSLILVYETGADLANKNALFFGIFFARKIRQAYQSLFGKQKQCQ